MNHEEDDAASPPGPAKDVIEIDSQSDRASSEVPQIDFHDVKNVSDAAVLDYVRRTFNVRFRAYLELLNAHV